MRVKQVDNLFFQKAADKLIDRVFLRFIPHSITPNQVTVVRFILVPIVYWLLVAHSFDLALVVFIIAASTDFIDGSMARTRDQITDVGKVIDPIADKLLIISVLWYIGIKYLIIHIFVIFILFEIIAVLIGTYFSHYIGKPIGANFFGKVKLILQSVSVALFILGTLIKNSIVTNISVYVLGFALVFAILAGLETARRKAIYLNKHKIKLNRL